MYSPEDFFCTRNGGMMQSLGYTIGQHRLQVSYQRFHQFSVSQINLRIRLKMERLHIAVFHVMLILQTLNGH
jgi:hypothetical protein